MKRKLLDNFLYINYLKFIGVYRIKRREHRYYATWQMYTRLLDKKYYCLLTIEKVKNYCKMKGNFFSIYTILPVLHNAKEWLLHLHFVCENKQELWIFKNYLKSSDIMAFALLLCVNIKYYENYWCRSSFYCCLWIMYIQCTWRWIKCCSMG